MLLSALLVTALASEAICQQCCRAGGLGSCATELSMFGEGSRVVAEADGVRVVGLWNLACDGAATFAASGTVLLDHEPQPGELVTAAPNPLQVHCVRQGCDLPQGACLRPADENGRFFLVGCADGLAPGALALTRPPSAPRYRDAMVALIDGKPLVVEPTVATPRPDPVVLPATGTVTTATAGTAKAPLDPLVELAASLPRDPSESCRPPGDAIRNEARKRVDMGDERRIGKDPAGAIHEYRAALTLDACNGYAWLGFGEMASNYNRTDLAIRALKNATRLLPAHTRAWTMLGRSYELIGQRKLAAEAYEKALALDGTLAEANEGWRRTMSPQ